VSLSPSVQWRPWNGNRMASMMKLQIKMPRLKLITRIVGCAFLFVLSSSAHYAILLLITLFFHSMVARIQNKNIYIFEKLLLSERKIVEKFKIMLCVVWYIVKKLLTLIICCKSCACIMLTLGAVLSPHKNFCKFCLMRLNLGVSHAQ